MWLLDFEKLNLETLNIESPFIEVESNLCLLHKSSHGYIFVDP